MIQPALKDAALLADIAAAPAAEDLLHLWWLGQSGFLVKHGARHFLFDPYLSDSLTHKYAATDKPHTRMTERCVAPEALGAAMDLSFVTASHIHTDHLDGETLVPLAKASRNGLRLFLPGPIVSEARARLGDAPAEFWELNDRDVCQNEQEGWTMRGIAAAHNDLKRDEHGRCHYIGFLLETGPFRLYHSGDTLWHEDLVPALQPARCDVMLLPINGNKPERRVSGNLNGTEAAALAKACGARLAVPCHYDMFTFNTESPEEFTTTCQRLSQACQVLRCGERLTLRARE